MESECIQSGSVCCSPFLYLKQLVVDPCFRLLVPVVDYSLLLASSSILRVGLAISLRTGTVEVADYGHLSFFLL